MPKSTHSALAHRVRPPKRRSPLKVVFQVVQRCSNQLTARPIPIATQAPITPTASSRRRTPALTRSTNIRAGAHRRSERFRLGGIPSICSRASERSMCAVWKTFCFSAMNSHPSARMTETKESPRNAAHVCLSSEKNTTGAAYAAGTKIAPVVQIVALSAMNRSLVVAYKPMSSSTRRCS